MKDFKPWGIRIRKDLDKNYYSIWVSLKTVRLDLGDTIELPADRSEFYDVGLGTRCNAECPFCYVSAKGSGEFWADPAGVWKRWMSMFPEDITIDPNNLPEDDEYIKELFGPLQKGDTANVVALKLSAQYVKKKGLPVVYTQKPFQIAIGK